MGIYLLCPLKILIKLSYKKSCNNDMIVNFFFIKFIDFCYADNLKNLRLKVLRNDDFF